ncbi:MAG: hypothetical protein ACK4M9_14135 [Anaerobacillus sp.]|uniref:hypothetical protein n=1 Tax=Anaerobacillus sp. TaxID=1872506 RepID=UPI00391B2EBB
MKYGYIMIFLLLLGGVFAIEQKVNKSDIEIEYEKQQLEEPLIPVQELEYGEEERHGLPPEFQGNYYNSDMSDRSYIEEGSSLIGSSEIKEQYTARFDQLKEEAFQDMTNLVEVAMMDYVSKKENDDSISLIYFYRTYYPKLKKLEDRVDAAFQEEYAQLETDLQKHGFSPKKAVPFKKEYEETKQNQLKEFMKLITN